jgi:hypothetical protein
MDGPLRLMAAPYDTHFMAPVFRSLRTPRPIVAQKVLLAQQHVSPKLLPGALPIDLHRMV